MGSGFQGTVCLGTEAMATGAFVNVRLLYSQFKDHGLVYASLQPLFLAQWQPPKDTQKIVLKN